MSDPQTNTNPQNDAGAPADDLTPEVTSATFEDFIKEGYTFIDCWAEWCQPCKMVEPTIIQIAKEWQGKVKVGKLDTDNNADTAMKFNIFGIPTFLLFKDGQLIDRLTGLNPPQVFTQFLVRNYQHDEAAA